MLGRMTVAMLCLTLGVATPARCAEEDAWVITDKLRNGWFTIKKGSEQRMFHTVYVPTAVLDEAGRPIPGVENQGVAGKFLKKGTRLAITEAGGKVVAVRLLPPMKPADPTPVKPVDPPVTKPTDPTTTRPKPENPGGTRVGPVEIFTDRAKFEARLKKVQVIDFEDVQTPDARDAVAEFAADRYADKGVLIKGAAGQFAGRQFSYPANYRPTSGVNVMAPGPQAPGNARVGAGGKETAVTFTLGGRGGTVAGFGANFIDVNYPGIAPSGLVVYDVNGKELARKLDLRGSTGQAVFVGVVAVAPDGQVTPAIGKVMLYNGSGWPQVYNNEGVVLDDFVFSPPVAAR